jgi:hypothetical protein
MANIISHSLFLLALILPVFNSQRIYVTDAVWGSDELNRLKRVPVFVPCPIIHHPLSVSLMGASCSEAGSGSRPTLRLNALKIGIDQIVHRN